MARYSDEEAKEILRRAIEQHHAELDGLDKDELIEAAGELGIRAELVEHAALEVREAAGVEGRKLARRKKERQRFSGRLATYAVVNAFLAMIDFMTGAGWWVQWPLIIWGFFVALDFVRLVHPASIERRDSRAERRYQRRVAHAARLRAKADAKRRRRGAESELEAAIEHGVAALLAAAAKGFDGLVSPPGVRSRPPGEFDRYVAQRKRGEGGGALVPGPHAPRARVDAGPHEEQEEVEERAGLTSRRSRSPR